MKTRTIKKELSDIRWWMLPILIIICLPMLIINYYSDNKWFCSFWGWHKRPEIIGFNGCSSTGKCPRCSKAVLQDSQGNWF